MIFCSWWQGTVSVTVIVSNRLREGCNVWNISLTWLWGFLVKISSNRLFFPSFQEWEQIQQFASPVGNWSKKFPVFFPLTELSRYSGFKSSNLFFPIQLQIFNKMKFGQKWGNCNVNFYISVRFSGGPGQNWRKLDVVSYPKGLVETCWNSIWTQ